MEQLEPISKMDNVPPVSINVGGETFVSTVETLQKIPYFDNLIRSGLQWPDFIDRCPKAFSNILNNARDSSYTIKSKYWPDAIYFGLSISIVENPPYCVDPLDESGHFSDPQTGVGPNILNAARMEFQNSRRFNILKFKPAKTNSNPFHFVETISLSRSVRLTAQMLYLLHQTILSDSIRRWIDYYYKLCGWHVICFPVTTENVIVHFNETIESAFMSEMRDLTDEYKFYSFANSSGRICALETKTETIFCLFDGETTKTLPIKDLSGFDTGIEGVINLLYRGYTPECYCYSTTKKIDRAAWRL